MITRLNKNVLFSQWMQVFRQLRPKATPEDVSSLIPWGYKFVSSIENGKVLGLGAYFLSTSFLHGSYYYLSDLVVDAECRNKGIGASLLKKITPTNLPLVLDSGLEKIEAHRFYLRHGFNHSGYTVRLKSSAFKSMDDFHPKKTVLIGNIEDIKKIPEKDQFLIQSFIDTTLLNLRHSPKNLVAFMTSNPSQHLLILKDQSATKIEGALLFELQNRLYIGGECFHVSDLIVPPDEFKAERENALLLELVRQARIYNAHNISPINSVIIEMTEREIKSHNIQLGDTKEEFIENKSQSSAPSITLHSVFCATAKHFTFNKRDVSANSIPNKESRISLKT